MTPADSHLRAWADQAIRPVIREILRDELADILPTLAFTSAPADEVLNVQQAANLLKRSTATIYGLVYEKRIPFHKPDGRLQFLRSELLEWVSSKRKSTAADLDEAARTVVADRINRRTKSKESKAAGNRATSKQNAA